jgi:hypothetical protein
VTPLEEWIVLRDITDSRSEACSRGVLCRGATRALGITCRVDRAQGEHHWCAVGGSETPTRVIQREVGNGPTF